MFPKEDMKEELPLERWKKKTDNLVKLSEQDSYRMSLVVERRYVKRRFWDEQRHW